MSFLNSFSVGTCRLVKMRSAVFFSCVALLCALASAKVDSQIFKKGIFGKYLQEKEVSTDYPYHSYGQNYYYPEAESYYGHGQKWINPEDKSYYNRYHPEVEYYGYEQRWVNPEVKSFFNWYKPEGKSYYNWYNPQVESYYGHEQKWIKPEEKSYYNYGQNWYTPEISSFYKNYVHGAEYYVPRPVQSENSFWNKVGQSVLPYHQQTELPYYQQTVLPYHHQYALPYYQQTVLPFYHQYQYPQVARV